MWTKRPCFAERPDEALDLLGRLADDPSDDVLFSAGNAVSDISKTHPANILDHLRRWSPDPRSMPRTLCSRHPKASHIASIRAVGHRQRRQVTHGLSPGALAHVEKGWQPCSGVTAAAPAARPWPPPASPWSASAGLP